MTASRQLLNLIPTLQAVALLKENEKESKKKKVKIVKLGMKNIIGTSLIKAQSDFIGLVD